MSFVMRLSQWRDRGDGPIGYNAGSADFALDVIRLMAENERMRQALEYYSNRNNWEYGDVPGHIYAIADAGMEARIALGLKP